MGYDFGYSSPDFWFENMDDAIQLVRIHELCCQDVPDKSSPHIKGKIVYMEAKVQRKCAL